MLEKSVVYVQVIIAIYAMYLLMIYGRVTPSHSHFSSRSNLLKLCKDMTIY